MKETNDFQAPVKELRMYFIKTLTVGTTTKLSVKSDREDYSVNETRLEHTVRLIDASSTRQI